MNFLKHGTLEFKKYLRTFTEINFLLLMVYNKIILKADDAQIWSEK
jgi:hypothetical protein